MCIKIIITTIKKTSQLTVFRRRLSPSSLYSLIVEESILKLDQTSLDL